MLKVAFDTKEKKNGLQNKSNFKNLFLGQLKDALF